MKTQTSENSHSSSDSHIKNFLKQKEKLLIECEKVVLCLNKEESYLPPTVQPFVVPLKGSLSCHVSVEKVDQRNLELQRSHHTKAARLQ